ncbi:hypothetical protein KUH32_13130 [Thalassococcus sp. CAU 1522]|uniref:Uncharacterized protein n=1 Tax=Thalassococcus arenae TaxID=2851652 RepID=A0ABS6N9Q0_9RHOB|nr:hypothetical protein [Thalassococcus arenae]MBV2360724.1 hypothetical protein [Thalassococcus arenae]
MILTLILAAAAGWAVKPAEPKVTEFLVRQLGEDRLPDAADRRVATLLILAFAAAMVLGLGADGARPVAFVMGIAVGYFHEEIRRAMLRR